MRAVVTSDELTDGRTYLRVGIGSGLRLIVRAETASAALEQLQTEGRVTLPARR